jgi:hypothetical protein
MKVDADGNGKVDASDGATDDLDMADGGVENEVEGVNGGKASIDK